MATGVAVASERPGPCAVPGCCSLSHPKPQQARSGCVPVAVVEVNSNSEHFLATVVWCAQHQVAVEIDISGGEGK